jgi:hypothetical protein
MIFNKKIFFWGFGAGILGTILLIALAGGITVWYLTSNMESELEAPVQAPKIDVNVFKKLRLMPAGEDKVESLNLNSDKVFVISFFDPTSQKNLVHLPTIGDLQKNLNNDKVAFYLIGESSMRRINNVSEKFSRKLPIFQLQDSLPEIFNHNLPKTYIVANNKIVFEHEGAANWNDSTVVNFINRQL